MSNTRVLAVVSAVAVIAVVSLVFVLGRNSGRGAERQELREGFENAMRSTMPGLNARQQGLSSSSNLKIIGLAIMIYSQKNGDKYPPMGNLEELKAAIGQPEQTTAEVWMQTGVGAPYVTNPSMSNKPVAELANPLQVPLLWEPQIGPDGLRAVLFADGHVKRNSPEHWSEIARAASINP